MHLGHLYYNGKSDGRIVNKDIPKSIEFYRRGCSNGFSRLCTMVGYIYSGGKGIEKNSSMAIQYFKKGCVGGSPNGCKLLKQMEDNNEIHID